MGVVGVLVILCWVFPFAWRVGVFDGEKSARWSTYEPRRALVCLRNPYSGEISLAFDDVRGGKTARFRFDIAPAMFGGDLRPWLTLSQRLPVRETVGGPSGPLWRAVRRVYALAGEAL